MQKVAIPVFCTLQCNSCTSVVQIDPFEVKPSAFDLSAGQMTILEVLFAPNTLDSFTEALVIVCDNCQVRRLIVAGLYICCIFIICFEFKFYGFEH